ncbi:MAG TPA: cytochrome C biogenesis protein, partial [Candidatus Marinimicrobia bacterium]|nr:cytochrome C biogenesis protein [Candidatus Neomarinimicrobiota bacterium]
MKALLWKDLLLEWRNKDAFVAMLAFTLLVFLLFSFAVDSIPRLLKEIAPGAMWISYLFAGTIGFNRLAFSEKENAAFSSVLLSPLDHSLIYLSKTIVSLILIFTVELISLPVLAFFYNIDFWKDLPSLLLVLLCASVGMAAIGTLFSTMLVNIRMKDLLMPLLSFPLLTPLLIAAVSLTKAVINGDGFSGQWLQMIITYD